MTFSYSANTAERIRELFAAHPWLARYVTEEAIEYISAHNQMNTELMRSLRTIWGTSNIEMPGPGPGSYTHTREMWIVDTNGELVIDAGFPEFPLRRALSSWQKLRFMLTRRKGNSVFDALAMLDTKTLDRAHFVVTYNGNSLALYTPPLGETLAEQYHKVARWNRPALSGLTKA